VKEKTHPNYVVGKVTCACGAEYEIGSTKEHMRLDICSNCHPLFTGKQKLLDSEGRVEKFKKKYTGSALAPKKKKVRAPKNEKSPSSKTKKK
jgi:large subunit ribosomal protein L31